MTKGLPTSCEYLPKDLEKIGLSCGPKAIALSLKLWTSHLQRVQPIPIDTSAAALGLQADFAMRYT